MKLQRKRITVFLMIVVLTLGILIANVFVVSVQGYHLYTKVNFKEQALKSTITTKELIAKRGNILDRNGNVIATDAQTYDLIAIIDPSRKTIGNRPGHVVDKALTAKQLAPILGASEQYLLDQLNQDLYQVQFGFRGSNLSLIQKQAIEQLDLPGLEFISSYQRQYPLGRFSSNLIGVAKYDVDEKISHGQMGIELLYDKELVGTNGKMRYQQDLFGSIIDDNTIETIPAVNGNNITLTIDQDIQESLEMAFKMTREQIPADKMFAAVMEVETGKILALGQAPSFNPKSSDEDNVYFNYGTDGAFEPGSTFKAFTYAAAIDSGNYDGDAYFNSSPFYIGSHGSTFDPYRSEVDLNMGKIQNALGRDWGYITYDEGFVVSSNVATSQILMNMGSETFKHYIEVFGFLKPIETDRFKTTRGNMNYTWAVEKLNTSFGQGLTVNVLQMLQAYSAILNDGKMVKPYFVENIKDVNDRLIYQAKTQVVGQPIQRTTAKKVQDLMRRCVVDEKGYCKIYDIEESEVLAKTGTSQIIIDGKYDEDIHITSVMAALPYGDPKVVVYFGYQSPIFDALYRDNRAGVKNLLKTIALKYDRNDHQKAVLTNDVSLTKVPSYINHSKNYLEQISLDLNINRVIIGDGDQIVAQVPNVGTEILSNQMVFLLSDGENWSMPDMTNWTLKDVTNFWSLTQLEITTQGSGRVVSQSIEAGTPIDTKTKISVILK